MIQRYPKILIILLNWNGRDDTLACLESVRKIDYKNFEVVVVDNGSIDDSVKVIRETFPEVTVLETGENLGFAGGNNVGIRHALEKGADYLFLLNNDTVVDPQILGRFMDATAHIGQEGILGAKIYYYLEPEKIWYAGAKWNRENSCFLHVGQDCMDDGKSFNTISETDYACGCALFVSARLLHRIGLLDEEYFLTFEETDLCYRAKKLGWKSYFVPEAKVWHKVSTSFGGAGSPMVSYYLTRNKLLWAIKNLSLSERLIIYRMIFKELLRIFTEACRRRYLDPVRKAKIIGVRDYILQRFGNCPESILRLRSEHLANKL